MVCFPPNLNHRALGLAAQVSRAKSEYDGNRRYAQLIHTKHLGG
jgi:hypothetical protein